MTPALSVMRTIGGAPRRTTIDEPEEKLRWRGALPGASTFDRIAHTLRALQAQGADAIELVPLALPASWMVNAKATSRAIQRWLSPSSMRAWATILEGIGFGTSPAEWLGLGSGDRDVIVQAVEVLASGDEGASLAAVTKALALLRPQLIPFMDDAALWYALELVPEPDTADAPRAGASAFAPMLDWFASQVGAAEEPLIAIAVGHDLAVLDAAQTLDRLVWVESWGHRLRRSG
jgi:hypothetical protein